MDTDRFEGLMLRYHGPLRRLSGAYAGGGAEADDLFQEVALALWTALPNFRGDSSERTWVYRVAHNTAISFVASQRKRREREPVQPPPIEPAAPDDPERELLDGEKRRRLQRAVHELPLPNRQVMLLHLEGLSAAEIETVAGCSAGAVATRLTRARQWLSEKVQGEEEKR
ncbi:MAG: RNA polymerase sigma factor [Bryobacteraceae bacterium]